MRKLITLLMFCLTLLSHKALAYPYAQGDANRTVSYWGVGLGNLHPEDHEMGMSAILSANKSLPNLLTPLSIQIELATSVIEPEKNLESVYLTSLSTYAMFRYDVDELVSFKVKMGLTYLLEQDTPTNKELFFGSFGFQTTYALENKKEIYLEYTTYENGMDMSSAGLHFLY